MPRLGSKAGSGSTILVVDDQDDWRQSTRLLLEREGHRVLSCASGDEALATLAQHDVQLILVDYCMPGMNGAELIRTIRASNPYVQIVLQTGYAGPTPPRTMLEELDIQGYHNKTQGPESLLLWVAVALKTHRLIQQLLERERVQADLVANVSHEFRTPLNIIGGYTQILLEEMPGVAPEGIRAPLQAIANTNRALAELVDNFLQYARVEAGAARSASDVVSTASLAQELLRLGTTLVADTTVAFTVTTAGAPAEFVTDSVKLRTVLRNLIGNAAKFTTAGEVRVELTGTDGAVVCRVRDTGPGIPADKQEAIFEPFRQLDGSWTRAHGGVGLGLALSRRLAHTLGGHLGVESRVGEGSVFTLTLPLPPAAGATDAAPEREGVAGAA